MLNRIKLLLGLRTTGWTFYHKRLRWSWGHIDNKGEIVAESDRNFSNFIDTLRDARRHGYVDENPNIPERIVE